DFDMVLVDDASTDRTASLAETLAARHSAVRFLRHEARRGFGACLRTGLQNSRHPLLVYSVCDNQYQPSDLKRCLKWIDKVDLVAGCRTVRGAMVSLSWPELWRRWLIRRAFGLHLRDIDCLFLVARRCIFGRISIQSDSLFAQVEILAKANFLG